MNYYKWHRSNYGYEKIIENRENNIKLVEELWDKHSLTELLKDLEWRYRNGEDVSLEFYNVLKERRMKEDPKNKTISDILGKGEQILIKKLILESNTDICSVLLMELKIREGKLKISEKNRIWLNNELKEWIIELLTYDNTDITRVELPKRRDRAMNVTDYLGTDSNELMGGLEIEEWENIKYLGSGRIKEKGYYRITSLYIYLLSTLRKRLRWSYGFLKWSKIMSIILNKGGIYSWWELYKGKLMDKARYSQFSQRNSIRWRNIINKKHNKINYGVYWLRETGDWVNEWSKRTVIWKYLKHTYNESKEGIDRYSNWISSMKLGQLDKRIKRWGRISEGYNQLENLLQEDLGRILGKTRQKGLRRGKITLKLGLGYKLRYVRTGTRWVLGITGEDTRTLTGKLWITIKGFLRGRLLSGFVKRNWKLLEVDKKNRVLLYMNREIRASREKISIRNLKSIWYTTLRGYTNHKELSQSLKDLSVREEHIGKEEVKKEKYLYKYHRDPWDSSRRLREKILKYKKDVLNLYNKDYNELKSHEYPIHIKEELWGGELWLKLVKTLISDIAQDHILRENLICVEYKRVYTKRNNWNLIVLDDWWEVWTKESWHYKIERPEGKKKVAENWWLKKGTYDSDPIGIITSTEMYKKYSEIRVIRVLGYKEEQERILERTSTSTEWRNGEIWGRYRAYNTGQEWSILNKKIGREIIWGKIEKVRGKKWLYNKLKRRVISSSEKRKNYNKTRGKLNWIPKYGYGGNVYYRPNQIKVGGKRDYKYLSKGYKNIWNRELPKRQGELISEYDKKRYQLAYKVRRPDSILLQNTGYLKKHERLEDTTILQLRREYYVHEDLLSVIKWYKDGGVSELGLRRYKEKVSHKRKVEKYVYTVYPIRLESSREKWKEFNLIIDRWYLTLSGRSLNNLTGVLGMIEQLEWWSNFRLKNWPYPEVMFTLLANILKIRGRVKKLTIHNEGLLRNREIVGKVYSRRSKQRLKMEGYSRGVGKRYISRLGYLKLKHRQPLSIDEKKYWTLKMHISNLLNKLLTDGIIDRDINEHWNRWVLNWEWLNNDVKERIWRRSLKWTVRRLSKELIYNKELYNKLCILKENLNWKEIFIWYVSWKKNNRSGLEKELIRRNKLYLEESKRIVDECKWIIELLINSELRETKTNISTIPEAIVLDRRLNLWNPERDKGRKYTKVESNSLNWKQWESLKKEKTTGVLKETLSKNELLYIRRKKRTLRYEKNIKEVKLLYNKNILLGRKYLKDLLNIETSDRKWELIEDELIYNKRTENTNNILYDKEGKKILEYNNNSKQKK